MNLDKVEDLKEIAAESGRSVAQLAIAWVLSNPVVSVALVGIRNPAEVEENISAADRVLTEREQEESRAVAVG